MSVRRWWGWPLVPLYWAGLRVKDALRRVAILRVRRLGWPVVSVGSLSAGGAGKTPVVMELARMLHSRGWTVDVLSRGYGRKRKDVERVNPLASDAAARYGDEPVLIARVAGVSVWVGRERFGAGMAAESSWAREQEADSSAALRNDEQIAQRNDKRGAQRDDKPKAVHLLDDGFQHRQLGRAMDVVLVTVEDLKDALLPAGNLREGLWALKRADVVVVREDERTRVEPQLRGLLRRDALLWIVRRQLRLPAGDGVRWLAFCAIARPEGFREMLDEAGYRVVETISFPDHHAFGMDDIERLMESARRIQATGFVATEKDQVKLSTPMIERLLTIGPVVFAKLEVTFLEEERVVRELEAWIR